MNETPTRETARTDVEPAWLWCVHEGHGPTLGLAVHAGHDVRPGLLGRLALSEADRIREEDPYTDYFAAACDNQVFTRRSRFEVDLNRPRDEAICFEPNDCWGLDVWDGTLPDHDIARALAEHAAFYRMLGDLLRKLEARHGQVVVFDVHAYNHRRSGGLPAPQIENPDINIGTGSMDRGRWAHLVDAALEAFRSCDLGGHPIDARENVRFKGREVAAFVHRTLPQTGCALAIEVKKTFMDERNGVTDDERLRGVRRAMETAVRAVRREVACHG